MWKCDLGNYTYRLPASWSHCLLVAAYWTTADRVSKSPKKFENMDSLLFYFQNSNPVWAHNGTLLSESGEKGWPQVWPQSLNSGFHVAGGDNMHFCARVSGCPGDVTMRSWLCPANVSRHWRCADLIKIERLLVLKSLLLVFSHFRNASIRQ